MTNILQNGSTHDFKLDKNGWISNVEQIKSPNFNQRQILSNEIRLIVIHNISLPPRNFDKNSIIDFFCNKLDCDKHPFFQTIKYLQVSAHLFIERNGNIVQFVSLHDRAWHAGLSSFKGKDNCNDYSIGIELQGCDDIAYTQAQYLSLQSIISFLQMKFPQICDNIVGHSYIAPNRKTDPGQAFDWKRIK